MVAKQGINIPNRNICQEYYTQKGMDFYPRFRAKSLIMRRSMTELPEEGPFRSEEELWFWKALTALADEEKANQGELAAFVGVSQGYVSKIMSGKQAPKPRLRRRFAEYFRLAYEDMLTLGRQRCQGGGYAVDDGAGPCRVREPAYGGGAAMRPAPESRDQTALRTLVSDLRARQFLRSEYTEVPLREATASMGGGSTETGDRALTYLSFRTDWIRAKGNPEYMTVIRAFGDSMEPTIADGSVVLVDEGRRQFVKNKIYYLRYNGQMYIKRLVEADGQLAIVSDGDRNMLLVSDADDFEIIGRCIWAARELE